MRTYFFARQADLADTFAIAEPLVHDPHPPVQKAVGSWIRERQQGSETAPPIPLHVLGDDARVMLTYAIEKLPPAARARYLR